MKIPNKVKIGGKVYEVHITNKLDMGNINYSGEICYQDLIIRICPQAQQKMEADFFHELVHAKDYYIYAKKYCYGKYDSSKDLSLELLHEMMRTKTNSIINIAPQWLIFSNFENCIFVGIEKWFLRAVTIGGNMSNS